MRFLILILSTAFATALYAPIAEAQTPASASSPAQIQTRKAAPANQNKSATLKKAPAATANKGEAQKLNPIVVTATRIPQPIGEIGTTITVVEAPQIQEQKIDRVADVLREVPGVQVTQSGSPGSVTDVSIRGATPSQTLVLIDGVEVNAGATGSFDLGNLTTGNLDRLEVLRGAGGSLYGSQAIGGVHQRPLAGGRGRRRPRHCFQRAAIAATSNQVGTFSGAEGNLGYSGAVSYFSTEGYRPVNDNSDNLSAQRTARLPPRRRYCPARLRALYRVEREPAQFSNRSLRRSPLDPTAHQRNEFMLFKGEIEHHFGENLWCDANAFFVRDRICARPRRSL